MRRVILVLFYGTVMAFMPSIVEALSVDSHNLINRLAASQSSLDASLKLRLGLSGGVNEVINTRSIMFWIGEGGVREDEWPRFFRHFHDPLQSWDMAGLQSEVGQYDSSIRWMQREDQGWSWQTARTFFLNALTSSSKNNRDQAFADTFRALGQIMHLVVDASVPEHTRNDIHPGASICKTLTGGFGCYGNYEYWVSKYVPTISSSDDFDPVILTQPTGDTEAPVSIARLIDTDTYNGLETGPDITLNRAIGIAEFANANFFSEGTILGPYPFPDSTQLDFSMKAAPQTGRVRAYRAKKQGPGNGIYVNPVLAECALNQADFDTGLPEPTYFCVDENVWQATADIMLPKAVGYAKGVLDYFFRGRLKGVLQRVNGPAANIGNFIPVYIFTAPYTVELKLTNESAEEMQGNFTLYSDDPDGNRTQLADLGDQTLAASETKTLSFTVPQGFGDVNQIFVVFQGRLGQEDGAVAGSVVGPELIEEWDKGLADNNPWGSIIQSFFMPVPHPDDNKQIIKTENGKLVMEIVRENPTTGDRYNTVQIGPRFDQNGNLFWDPRDSLPVPITSRTLIKLNYDINNEQPPCSVGRTCHFQFIEFGFSGQRYLQFTMPGQGANLHMESGARVLGLVPVSPGAPLTVNIHDVLTQYGIPTDNLVLEKIVLTQGLVAYPDPDPHRLHMEVDYIRVTEPDPNVDSGPGTGGGVVSGGNSPPVGSPPRVTLTSPNTGEVLEGATIALSADATDDGRVVSVEFEVNGVSQFVDTSAPFTTQYVVPVGVGSLTITLKAIDDANNFTSVTYLITVLSPSTNSGPTVVITSPAAGSTFMEGQTVNLTVTVQGNNAAVAFTEILVNGTRVASALAPFVPSAAYTVPVGVTQLTIGADAMDVNGNVGVATPVIVNVIPDPPPTVAITSPAEGTTVIEGTQLTLSANATDNVQVSQLIWSVNGLTQPQLYGPPYQTVIVVPIGATSMTIQATAIDNLGKTATATRTITVRPDPGTAVVGRIAGTDRRPFAGATVTVFGQFTAQSGADGTFSIQGVPTIRGRISVAAEALVGTTPLQGRSLTFAPVTNGTTNVGTILLQPALYPGRKQLVGNGPYSVALADLNRDASLDLVTANSQSSDVSVLVGNGDGTFQNQQRFAVGDFPSAVAVGDFNRDGLLDVVTANGGSADVSVLLGNGDGTFQNQQRFAVSDYPYSVVVTDLNRDGFLDIVTSNNGTNDVSVLLGNGDGTFQAQRRFAAGVGPESVAVADVNGDGFADLVTANDATNVSVLFGNGDGTLQTPQSFDVGDFPYSVTVADVNGDGFADIVTANGNSNDVSVLLGNGAGTFQAPQRFAAGDSPRFVTVADMNGDGLSDLVTTNAYSNDVSVLLGNGNGTFQETFHWVDDRPRRSAVGDFPASVAVADLNGDGFADIVTVNVDSDDFSVLLSNGDNTFQDNPPPPLFYAYGAPYSVTAADLNMDGKPDIITANQFPDGVAILLGNGDGTFQFTERLVAGISPNSVAVADLNRDGLPDLVTANTDSNDVSVLLGNGGGAFRTQQIFAAGDYPYSLAIADLNGDGFLDLVTLNAGSNDVSILLGNGDGTFQTQQIFAVGDWPGSVAVADLNNDGKPDLVTANESNDVSVLLGNGNGTFQIQKRFAAGDLPYSAVVADINGDGLLDLVTVNGGSDDVAVLLGNGDGTFQAAQFFAAGHQPGSVTVVDLNGDGKPDLVTGNTMLGLDSTGVSVLLHE